MGVQRIIEALALSLLTAALALASAQPAAALDAVNNTMLVRIQKGGESHLSERIVLPLNKAAIVELPLEARDVLVSNPAIVDAVIRSSRRTYILGMSVGQTNAFFFDAEGRQILNLEIRVERDLEPLNTLLGKFLPDARFDVEALNDNIVLRGSVPNAVKAQQAADIAGRFVGDPKKVLNMVSIMGNEQVLLQVRVVEMKRTLIKQLGIDTSASLSIDQFTFDWETDNPFSLAGRSFGGAAAGAARSLATGGVSGPVGGNLVALERAGLVRTLAEPNLTAISGEAASFLAGGEFPVPISRDRDGNVQIEFKPFGVGLGFTPLVLDEGRISLKISTEVSELSTEGAFFLNGNTTVDPDTGEVFVAQGLQVPGLTVRRAQTTVELPSGGSLVMAGLLQEDLQQNIDGVPGLKDVAVLGQLFRSRDYLNNETELVIIVTPLLVEPTSKDKLTDPSEGFAPATELETILLGRLNAVYGVQRNATSDPNLQGPVGFILD